MSRSTGQQVMKKRQCRLVLKLEMGLVLSINSNGWTAKIEGLFFGGRSTAQWSKTKQLRSYFKD
jgi:hypothetical protein